jgi:hypothetical protein
VSAIRGLWVGPRRVVRPPTHPSLLYHGVSSGIGDWVGNCWVSMVAGRGWFAPSLEGRGGGGRRFGAWRDTTGRCGCSAGPVEVPVRLRALGSAPLRTGLHCAPLLRSGASVGMTGGAGGGRDGSPRGRGSHNGRRTAMAGASSCPTRVYGTDGGRGHARPTPTAAGLGSPALSATGGPSAERQRPAGVGTPALQQRRRGFGSRTTEATRRGRRGQ